MHIQDLIARSKFGFGIAMAFQAGLHQPGIGFSNNRHCINLAVAGDATHPLVKMNAVIEINVVRQIMDADPLDGFVFAET